MDDLTLFFQSIKCPEKAKEIRKKKNSIDFCHALVVIVLNFPFLRIFPIYSKFNFFLNSYLFLLGAD